MSNLDSTAAAAGRGTAEREPTVASAPAWNGTPKCKNKNKKKKNKMQEQQESPPDLDSSAAAEAEEQVEAKERAMEGQEDTDAAASALNGTPNCKKRMKKKNKMQDKQVSPPYLDSTTAAEAEEQGEAKGRGMEEREATAVAASALGGTPECDQEEAKVKDSVMLKEEATNTVVSASEGTPKRKRRRKRNKMQELLESPHPQTSLGIFGVDKIIINNENSRADAVEASGHADVNMDPINGEDPSCAQSNANGADVLVDNCSNNSQENSTGRKRQKKKRKWGSSSRWPGFSSENDGMVADSMDSSVHHDVSCVCASCLVETHNNNIKNIYSSRGSLVRFHRKKLLILDLNGLLADINQDYHNVHKADAKVKDKLVFTRPYYDDFLRFCFQNFELGIWSSRKRENVNRVVNILMRKLKHHLLFCWDMSYCTVTGCNTIEKKGKPLVLKELKKLWNKEDPDLPWEQGEFSPSNTLLVDDSPYKALCNPPNTGIFPLPYSYRNQSDNSLGPGGDLRMYLERVAAADNVQNFVRDNPFGQNSITESDPNWNFYVQIVDKVEKAYRIVDKVEKANS
ncbi:uncharacterized protein LOC120660103 isoform X3 [Panicum virgatum]|uniref:Mitochondrial import inner membrane translocase subunit TIM50 n=1 Tax=Panicum virgatum TaxID=38727 RepID=A0A8T0VH84_PANVG|nr:uncharacterized protein LOC120660103 isoform X3 [Panicum virgatum]KAG2633797.1 hypothetical protein PVAP13_2NG295100 [Panicum virgatum]